MKQLITAAILFFLIKISSFLNFTCEYGNNDDWWIAKNIYQCNVNGNFSVKTSEESLIMSISGSHSTYYTNNDVKAMIVQNFSVHYFLTGMETFFKNLELIDISQCQIREIHQIHFKPFPKLRAIILSDNAIEVLQNGLFDYNLNLEMIWIS
ncbi:hypothetical protein ACKWTF_012463 [Chironomus riparius]